MGFKTSTKTTKTAPQKEMAAPSKPDWILKVPAEEGAVNEKGQPIKYHRVGAGWTTDKGGIKITFDDGVEITSTEKDRAKALLFPNTMPTK